MVVLGVDPGIKHTGIAVWVDGGIAHRETVIHQDPHRITVAEALEPILDRLRLVVRQFRPTVACVEQVGWYGRAKRITLPLSHVAGAITGYLMANGIGVYLLYAKQKTAIVRFNRTRGANPWDEHQKDAARLAATAAEFEAAQNSEAKSLTERVILRKQLTKHYIAAMVKPRGRSANRSVLAARG